jgi:hypothetical protein
VPLAFGLVGLEETAGTVAVRLTDDDGALATAVGVDATNPLGGRLWAFKPFAKDGSISFTAGAAESAALAIEDLECTLTASDQALTVKGEDIEVEAVAVSSEPIALALEAQLTAQ